MNRNLENITFSSFDNCYYFGFISDEVAKRYSEYMENRGTHNIPNIQGHYMCDEYTGEIVSIDDKIEELTNIINKMEKEMSKF